MQESDATRASGEAARSVYFTLLISMHGKVARRAVLVRLEPRLHRGGLRGADEIRVAAEVQPREVRQRNDRFRESSELVVEEVELLQARQLTDRVRQSRELVAAERQCRQRRHPADPVGERRDAVVVEGESRQRREGAD